MFDSDLVSLRLKEIACAGVYKASHRRGNKSDHVVKIDCIHVIVASLVYTQENASVDNTTGPFCNPFFLELPLVRDRCTLGVLFTPIQNGLGLGLGLYTRSTVYPNTK